MNHGKWIDYFEKNRAGRIAVPWDRGVDIPPHLRQPLIRSLQRFQVGESGDGLYLRRNAAALADPAYFTAIDLFIKEEQEHARLLAQVLKTLGAPLLKRHWSATVFRLVRQALGLKQELLVLLVAEMIAKKYYRALNEGTDDPVLRAVFRQILNDELGHLAFHIEHLRRFFAPWPFAARLVICELWRAFYRVVCLVVWLDHRPALQALKVTPEGFWWDCGLIFEEVSNGVFNNAPLPAVQPTSPLVDA
jgi:hypothetical protein